MSNELAVVEKRLMMLEPKFADVLPPYMPTERIIRTVMIAVGRDHGLANHLPSLMQAAMTAAVLGLEADGVMGQGCIVRFKNRAQFLPMVGGYVTLAGRAGRTLESYAVYDGDEFEFDIPANKIHHKWTLKSKRERVIGAWSISRSNDIPDLIRVLSLDDILLIRNNTAGWKSGRQTPWKTHFAAMAEKTAARANAKRIPVLSLHIANAIDTQHDLGRHAYAPSDNTVIVDGEVEPQKVEEAVSTPQPTAEQLGIKIIRSDANASEVRDSSEDG